MAKIKADSPAPQQMDDVAIRSVVSQINSFKAQMEKYRGEIGQSFKQFEEAGGDKAALKQAMKLHNMEEIDAQKWMRNLARYTNALKVFATPDLFDGLFGQSGDKPAVYPASPILQVIDQSMSEAHPQEHQAGRKAAEAGQPLVDNPHRTGCELWQAWQNGHLERMYEMANADTSKLAGPRTTDDGPEPDPLVKIAKDEGLEAGLAGKSRDTNLYEESDSRFPVWDAAWVAGDKARKSKEPKKPVRKRPAAGPAVH